MQKSVILTVTLTVGLAVEWCLARIETTRVDGTADQNVPFTAADTIGRTLTLDELCSGGLKVVDLTWPLNAKAPFWPGDNYKPFELKVIATLEKNGVLSKSFCMPEHQGTHIDAPNHFEPQRASVDRIPPADLFAAGVLIDVSGQVASQPDYALTLADVEAWERKNGRIPPRAVVLLKTGWGRHFENSVRYRNQDMMGRMHFPGFSDDAVRFLIDEREIRGVGLDTLSVDPGQSRDFAVHHRLGQAGRYGLENLAGLDELPAKDFYLVIAPIKIETGTGGPTRVLAIAR